MVVCADANASDLALQRSNESIRESFAIHDHCDAPKFFRCSCNPDTLTRHIQRPVPVTRGFSQAHTRFVSKRFLPSAGRHGFNGSLEGNNPAIPRIRGGCNGLGNGVAAPIRRMQAHAGHSANGRKGAHGSARRRRRFGSGSAAPDSRGGTWPRRRHRTGCARGCGAAMRCGRGKCEARPARPPRRAAWDGQERQRGAACAAPRRLRTRAWSQAAITPPLSVCAGVSANRLR